MNFLIISEVIILLFVALFIAVWIISEVIIARSIKNRKNDESIWLAINIMLPIIGCIIYKLTHKTINE